MGLLNKIGLTCEKDVFDADPFGNLHALTRSGKVLDAVMRPFDTNLVMCVVGGDHAEALDRAGEEDAIEWALAALEEIYGSAVRDTFEDGVVTRWASDPWALGACAATTPGRNHLRARLAEPVGDRVFFAGEACVAKWATQRPAAHLSGLDTAREAARVVR